MIFFVGDLAVNRVILIIVGIFESTIYSGGLRFFLRYNSKKILNYVSLGLFICLMWFVSVSVSSYINRTMSISLRAPEVVDNSGSETEIISNKKSVIVVVKRGDTFESIIKNNVSGDDSYKLLKVASNYKNLHSLKIGQKIILDYDVIADDLSDEISESLIGVKLEIDPLNFVTLSKVGDSFIHENNAIPVHRFVTKSHQMINSNVAETLKSLGLSNTSIAEVVSAYSYTIDFQRQIHDGDSVKVILETFLKESGEFSHYGKVLSASLLLSGKEYNIYRYNVAKNVDTFFSEDGKSIKRNLLTTPLNVMKISSCYGHRKHPISGYTKMHKGIDFAAPEGTPIYAAGDGVITEMNYRSGYGKFIQIKHSPTLSTAYAHAKNFAKQLKVGSKVKQGMVIAYVGMSGRTTGAHLHYEVKINGKHVNPQSIKTSPNTELVGVDFRKFEIFKKKVRKLDSVLDSKIEIATNDLEVFR